MHGALSFASGIVGVLTDAASYLSSTAMSACAMSPSAVFDLAAVAVSSSALTALCSTWFLGRRVVWSEQKRDFVRRLRQAHFELYFRDALIAAYSEAAVVFRPKGSDSYRDGAALLKTCLAGADGENVASLVEALRNAGQRFECEAHANGRSIHLRGLPVGRFPVVFLRTDPGVPDTGERGTSCVLAASKRDQERARPALRVDTAAVAEIDTPAKMALKDRPAVNADPSSDASAGIALFDSLATGVAVFGTDQKLVLHNSAYEHLWGLSPPWLELHPTAEEVFDELRQTSRLPELRDYVLWKRDLLRLFQEANVEREELWHLHGDKSVRVTIQSAPGGGLIFLFDDVSDRFAWERTSRTLSWVQQVTLDHLSDAVMVIGPDGCLKQHNVAFEELWHIDRAFLSAHPHFSQIAARCDAMPWRECVWEIVASGVMSGEPESLNPWSEVAGGDSQLLSLTTTRLPDGATLVVFTDKTRVDTCARDGAALLQVAA